MNVLAWVLGGSEDTGTAELGLAGLSEPSPTFGLDAETVPGMGGTHYVRFRRYVPLLAELGVEVRPLPWPAGTTLEERYELVQKALDWADVATWWPWTLMWLCADCPFASMFDAHAALHWESGHRVFPSDIDLRSLWSAAVARRDVGLVMDVDDRWPEQPTWWAPEELRASLPDPYRPADLLTVSTPVLEKFARRQNVNVRVIRNSVDAAAFVPEGPRPDGPTRLVWYGLPTRERDYTGAPLLIGERASYCRAGVQDHRARLRTVYIGAHPLAPSSAQRMRAAGFDEIRPLANQDKWPRTLAASYPEIGVAPLIVNAFASCKSELHWMEYAACGAPTVAERFRGGGPYDCIREGVDGLLAHGRQEWSDAIGRLAREPQLRADIGGAARERVIREYDPRQRAAEMADAYRWGAEHAGIGR
jgi:hypothetical protein